MKHKRLRNRRGIAIELALSMMVIVFSLCALMTTVVTVSRKQSNTATARFVQSAEVDALGEAFAEGKTPTSDRYDCAVSDNTLTVSKNGKVLLVVVKNADGTVQSWQH